MMMHTAVLVLVAAACIGMAAPKQGMYSFLKNETKMREWKRKTKKIALVITCLTW